MFGWGWSNIYGKAIFCYKILTRIDPQCPTVERVKTIKELKLKESYKAIISAYHCSIIW